MAYRAEPAATGACVPEDHEGCRTLVPAFAEVRTSGALADGMQLISPEKRLDLAAAAPARHFDTYPWRKLWPYFIRRSFFVRFH